MYYPQFLKKGQTIGICAPSAGTGEKPEHYERALEQLRAQGFYIKESKSVRNTGITSARASVRSKEFTEMFLDPEVDFVLSAAGGDFLMEMLEGVKWNEVRRHPKWFMGMSDPSTLLYILPTAYDIASLYGHNAGSFDYDPLPLSQQYALSYMQGDLVKEESFPEHFVGIGSDDLPVEETYWKTPHGDVDVEGRVLGGCVDALRDIVGTDLDHTEEFLKRYEDEGVIWFLDNFALSAEDLYHCLWQMKKAGWFRTAKAVLFGRTLFPSTHIGFRYRQALEKIFGRKIPLIMEADVGHTTPCLTLINGGYARVQAAEGKGNVQFYQK